MSTLSAREEKALRAERRKLLEEMKGLSLIIHGSYFERYSTCSRPNCGCHKGERHGPRAYVAARTEGAARQRYIRKDQAETVREGIGQYHRLMEIADRISEINLTLARAGRLGYGAAIPRRKE